MKIKLIFAWFDFWVGAFWDSKKKWLYIFPIPMFGIILKFDLEPNYKIETWESDHFKENGKIHILYFKGDQVGTFESKYKCRRYMRNHNYNLPPFAQVK